ncbi:MAG: glycosyltransferase [Calditrichaeota bacterium]|nr:glycosyltransferase [Calditrichota bacterium]
MGPFSAKPPSLNGHLGVLIPGFAENEQDSTCIPILQDYLAALRHYHPGLRISLVAFQYPFSKGHYFWKGISVHSLGGQNRAGLRRWRTWREARRTLLDIHRRDPLDLLHSFWLSECALVGQKISAQSGIPHLCSVLGQDALPQNRYLGRFGPDLTITCGSQRSADQLKQSADLPAKVIPMGIFPPHLPAPAPVSPKKIDILGVGSLVAVKNYGRFISLFARLREQVPGLRGLIAGEGVERQILADQIARLGLQENLTLAGGQSRQQIGELMQQSRILLHTARYEGQCLALWEALYYGLEVVTTPVGIAENRPQMFCASGDGDLLARLRDLLGKAHQGEPHIVTDIRETLEKMCGLYEKLAPRLAGEAHQ